MYLKIEDYPDDTTAPPTPVEVGGWPAVVQVGPLDGSGRLSVSLWRVEAAYAGGKQFGSEEYVPGDGALPTLTEMLADPEFRVAWSAVGAKLLGWAAARHPGAEVVFTPEESQVFAAFQQFVAALPGGP